MKLKGTILAVRTLLFTKQNLSFGEVRTNIARITVWSGVGCILDHLLWIRSQQVAKNHSHCAPKKCTGHYLSCQPDMCYKLRSLPNCFTRRFHLRCLRETELPYQLLCIAFLWSVIISSSIASGRSFKTFCWKICKFGDWHIFCRRSLRYLVVMLGSISLGTMQSDVPFYTPSTFWDAVIACTGAWLASKHWTSLHSAELSFKFLA